MNDLIALSLVNTLTKRKKKRRENQRTSARRRRRREKLWKVDPFCHWCDILTILPPIKSHEGLQDNTATIDHLYSKLNPKRYEVFNGVKIVIACNKCNSRRNEYESKILFLEEQKKRSREGYEHSCEKTKKKKYQKMIKSVTNQFFNDYFGCQKPVLGMEY